MPPLGRLLMVLIMDDSDGLGLRMLECLSLKVFAIGQTQQVLPQELLLSQPLKPNGMAPHKDILKELYNINIHHHWRIAGSIILCACQTLIVPSLRGLAVSQHHLVDRLLR
jgi:hypothetical protein